eukprot:5271344-Pyramimonas_sp.AAC.1
MRADCCLPLEGLPGCSWPPGRWVGRCVLRQHGGSASRMDDFGSHWGSSKARPFGPTARGRLGSSTSSCPLTPGRGHSQDQHRPMH